jgi:CrcB protein
MLPHWLAVMIGGAFGALARYGVGRAVVRLAGEPVPWATWAANLTGCLLIGVAVTALQRAEAADTARLLVVTGFLGAFTTFSTFSLDTLRLWTAGQPGLALLNAGGSVVLGLLFVWLGVRLAGG